ncbi:centromere protein N isoform X2 [Cynoglossus semilaevis]|nr:centromere protein N isoform X2 [Cynoglossus semilaevis]
MKHITELEMINVIDSPNQSMWHALQLIDPGDDAQTVEFIQFKKQFKSHLVELVRHVSIKIKKHTDEAIWIRIAWGDSYTRPNHMKPTYAVHHLQTPYVFVTTLTSKQKPLLSQALLLSTQYQTIKEANLSGRKLTAIRDLLMKQYQQMFPNSFPSLLTETKENVPDPHKVHEQAGTASTRGRLACETFGRGALPQIETTVYKLDTKYKDPTNQTMSERSRPFKCVVKFESKNLLESLRHCATSGIVSTPVAQLLSSIPKKGRNFFYVTDTDAASSSQRPASQV